MTRTFLFLDQADAASSWITVDEHKVLARGQGIPQAEAVVAVAPAEAVTLHWAAIPARSIAQATAAARIVVADAIAAPATDLHVAVGEPDGDERPIAVVAHAAMVDWLARLARSGVEPAALVPAPMLLPVPDTGYVRAELGGRGVIRGSRSGFADDAGLTNLLTGGEVPASLDSDATDAALIGADTLLDLRQGPYARRRRRGIDWALVRRAVAMGLGVLALTLAIDIVRIAKYSFAADALERRADAAARRGLPRGDTVVDPDRQIAERVGGVRGPGLGFTGTAAAAFQAVRTVPGAELTALDFQPTGDLRLGIATAREAEATDVKRALEAVGFRVDAGVFQSAGGRVTGEMTVRLP